MTYELGWNISTYDIINSTRDSLDALYASAYDSNERRRIQLYRNHLRKIERAALGDMDGPEALAWAAAVMTLGARVARIERGS